MHPIQTIHTNLNSSAGASEALLLYIDDILRSLTGRSCQRASSGSVLRRLDTPASSPRIPVARFVPLNDISLNCPQPTCSRSFYCFTLRTRQQHCVECHIIHYMALQFASCKPETKSPILTCTYRLDDAFTISDNTGIFWG